MCPVQNVTYVSGRSTPSDRALARAELTLNFGQMAFRLRICRQTPPGRFEPVAGAVEVPMRQPHVPALKLKLRHRKRRDASEPPGALVEPTLSNRNLTKFGIEEASPARFSKSARHSAAFLRSA